MGSILFAAGYLFCLLVASAVSVYGLDFADPSWGPSMSFQVLAWMSLAACLLATLVYASGLVIFRRSSNCWRAVAQGLLAGILSIGALSLGAKQVVLAVAVVAGAALVAAATAKRHGA